MLAPNLFDPEWLTAAFAATSAVRALFFIPQVIAVARSVDGARDISLPTWWMWTVNNVLGALYAGEVMNHQVLALSFWGSAAACAATIVLTMRARRRFDTTLRRPPCRCLREALGQEHGSHLLRRNS